MAALDHPLRRGRFSDNVDWLRENNISSVETNAIYAIAHKSS
jgi:hypothetical protein